MNIALIDSILSSHKNELGGDYEKYRNHVCRVYSYAIVLTNASDDEKKQLAIAAAFHDIGIWSANTFDYLNPSIQLAEEYLAKNKLQHWNNTVKAIIYNHHKLSKYKTNNLAESFRKADLIDLTFGVVKFGISKERINKYNTKYPAKGFQLFILKEILKNTVRHPLNPLPIVKW